MLRSRSDLPELSSIIDMQVNIRLLTLGNMFKLKHLCKLTLVHEMEFQQHLWHAVFTIDQYPQRVFRGHAQTRLLAMIASFSIYGHVSKNDFSQTVYPGSHTGFPIYKPPCCPPIRDF